jgi:hypothetical protein
MDADKRVLLAGGLLGAMLGAAIAWMLLRSRPPTGEVAGPARPIGPGDLLKLINSFVHLSREIVDLRERMPAGRPPA